MRQQQEVAVLDFAPGTCVSIAKLDKINRPVMLRAPTRGTDLTDFLVDLNERTWAQQRVKGEVAKTDVTIKAVAKVEMLNERNGNLAPDFNHSIEQVGVIYVKRTVKTDRKRNRLFRVIDFHGDQVGIGELQFFLMLAELLQIDTEQQQQIGEPDPIDRAKRVQFVNAGDGS